MAYFGKEFVVDKEENYADFIKSLNLSEAETTQYIGYKPKTKLEKNGDTYKVTTVSPAGTKVVEFKSGVEFEEQPRPDFTVQCKYTVDGDTVTQEMSKDGKTCTFKREYSADQLKVTITASFWDGVAYRYYKAA